MTTGCLQSFIDAATTPGEAIHHDTLNVLAALLHSASESRKHVRFRKDDFVSEYRTLPLRLEKFRTRCYCLARRERWFTNVAAPLLPVSCGASGQA